MFKIWDMVKVKMKVPFNYANWVYDDYEKTIYTTITNLINQSWYNSTIILWELFYVNDLESPTQEEIDLYYRKEEIDLYYNR